MSKGRYRAYRRHGAAWLVFALAAVAPGARGANLSWERQVAEIVIQPGQTDVEIDFPFRNVSARRVAILSVETGCDCTSAHVDSPFYDPGQTGRAHVVFHVGDFTGLHEEAVHVVTDEPQAAPDEILLRIHIPQDLVIAPRVLIWKLGTPPDEKIITCAALPGRKIVVSRAVPTDPSVTTSIETIEPGQKYHVHVKLAATSASATTTVRLDVTVNGTVEQSFRAYANVVPF